MTAVCVRWCLSRGNRKAVTQDQCEYYCLQKKSPDGESSSSDSDSHRSMPANESTAPNESDVQTVHDRVRRSATERNSFADSNNDPNLSTPVGYGTTTPPATNGPSSTTSTITAEGRSDTDWEPISGYQLCDVDNMPPVQHGMTRFVVISDTHEFHEKMKLPAGDVLLHCGDILLSDTFSPRWLGWYRLKQFFKWVDRQPHTHKVVVAGNHDGVAARYGEKEVRTICGTSVTYLCDDLVNVAGYNIYGSPRSTGSSPNKAFQDPETWNRGPPAAHDGTNAPIDILITHQHAGARRLRQFLAGVDPRIAHFCGHDHAGRGVSYPFGYGGIPSFNAANIAGKPFKERLCRVTVVDVPNTTHGQHYQSPLNPTTTATTNDVPSTSKL